MISNNASDRLFSKELGKAIWALDLPYEEKRRLQDLIEVAQHEAWRIGAEAFGANPTWWGDPLQLREDASKQTVQQA